MPELPEVEAYRALGERALHRRVAEVVAPDAWYLKGGLTAEHLVAVVAGRAFDRSRRIGKLMLLDTADGTSIGLRFGMTGRLLVDGEAGVEELEYSSVRDVAAWDRILFRFEDGGDLRIRDPRRLGGVLLEPDEALLGVDALTVTPAALRKALGTSSSPLKARLMDQSRLAGVGNLIADEALYRSGLDPARPAASLSPAELRRLHRALRSTVALLIARGGSHTGDLQPARRPGGTCPKDGTALVRRTVGGRTTWSCPSHQR